MQMLRELTLASLHICHQPLHRWGAEAPGDCSCPGWRKSPSPAPSPSSGSRAGQTWLWCLGFPVVPLPSSPWCWQDLKGLGGLLGARSPG